jgi:hypothetical protein
MSGPTGTRPRLGLRPTVPHHDDGMRIDPAMSDPCAIGTMPVATAAAAPPLDPATERVRSQGLRVGPKASGCVVGCEPNSDVFVRPATTKPARRKRAPSSVSADERCRRASSARLPEYWGSPACVAPMSLSSSGRPMNGVRDRFDDEAAARASSSSGAMTAFTPGLRRSIRRAAASTSSRALTSPRRTSSA